MVRGTLQPADWSMSCSLGNTNAIGSPERHSEKYVKESSSIVFSLINKNSPIDTKRSLVAEPSSASKSLSLENEITCQNPSRVYRDLFTGGADPPHGCDGVVGIGATPGTP